MRCPFLDMFFVSVFLLIMGDGKAIFTLKNQHRLSVKKKFKTGLNYLNICTNPWYGIPFTSTIQ
jgi:hypothetical protein